MKKSVLAIIVAVAAVGTIVVLALANNNSSKKPTSSTNSNSSSDMSNMQNSEQNGTQNQSSQEPAATSAVEIKNFAFTPAKITVKVGTTVTWTNRDLTQHNVEPDNDSSKQIVESNLLSKDQSYSFTFKTAGTYTYHCGPHPYMKGTVVVTE